MKRRPEAPGAIPPDEGSVEHDIRHDLEPARAQQVAKQALQSYSERFSKYSPEIQWRSDTQADVAFTVKGMRLAGGLKIEPDRFRLSLDVPFMLRPFKGRAFAVIEREVQGWLAKAKSGQA
jgi:hypothetical protein